MVYETIFESSLAECWEAMVVFMCLLAAADENDDVYGDVERVARKIRLPERIVRKGIEALEAPDPYSRDPAHQGRRIVRLPLVAEGEGIRGWHIVNRAKYRRLWRKRYMRRYMAAKRERAAAGP